ncbi:MAG TPA: hypothetical protein VHW23_14455 [Kofleriaceae bacterium]|jgi:hypothetical protein|nr:hypothetical protein [Kofleriaceae bacterium]
MASAADIYRDLLALPEQERLQLVERVIHDLVDAARHRTTPPTGPAARSVIGLWADEPEVADQIIEGALQQREARRLRVHDDALRDE